MKKRLKQIHYSSVPLLIVLGFLVGVAICFFWSNNTRILLVALIFFFCLINAFIFRSFGRLFFAFSAGILLATLRFQNISNSRQLLNEYLDRNIELELKLNSTVSHKNKNWRFEARKLKIGDQQVEDTIYISLPDSNPKPQRGDKLLLSGKLQEGFGKYDYYVSNARLIEESKPDPPDYSLELYERFASSLQAIIIDTNETALGLGYLTGQKDLLSEEFNEKLRNVGLAHVVVASGFHLSFITTLARKSLKKVSRFASYFAAFLAMIFFISITGLSASMLRAGLVTGMSLFAGYYGRKFHPFRLLAFAAGISLFYNPFSLQDVGWQLSFACFAGLLFFAPLLQDYFFDEDTSFVASSIIQTISAQLFCLPISLYTFGSFSPIGIISSLIIPPTIPLTMILCVLAALFAGIPAIGKLTAWLARLLLGFHVGVINYLNHFEWASQKINVDTRVFLLYLLIISVCLFLKLRTKHDFRPLLARLQPMEKSQKDGKIYSC